MLRLSWAANYEAVIRRLWAPIRVALSWPRIYAIVKIQDEAWVCVFFFFAGNFMWWTCIWKIEFMFDEPSNLIEYVVLGSCRNIHAWVMWCDWESHCVCSLYCINWNDSDKMKKKKNISCFIGASITFSPLFLKNCKKKVLKTLIAFWKSFFFLVLNYKNKLNFFKNGFIPFQNYKYWIKVLSCSAIFSFVSCLQHKYAEHPIEATIWLRRVSRVLGNIWSYYSIHLSKNTSTHQHSTVSFNAIYAYWISPYARSPLPRWPVACGLWPVGLFTSYMNFPLAPATHKKET